MREKETWLDRLLPLVITLAIVGYAWLVINVIVCDCDKQPTPAPSMQSAPSELKPGMRSILERE